MDGKEIYIAAYEDVLLNKELFQEELLAGKSSNWKQSWQEKKGRCITRCDIWKMKMEMCLFLIIPVEKQICFISQGWRQ